MRLLFLIITVLSSTWVFAGQGSIGGGGALASRGQNGSEGGSFALLNADGVLLLERQEFDFLRIEAETGFVRINENSQPVLWIEKHFLEVIIDGDDILRIEPSKKEEDSTTEVDQEIIGDKE